MNEATNETDLAEKNEGEVPTLVDFLSDPRILPGAGRTSKLKIMKRGDVKSRIKKRGLHGLEKKMARKKYFR